MMLHPSIDQLMDQEQIDSKYTLVVATAKRARQLQDTGMEQETKSKFVGTALKEISARKIKIVTQAEQQNRSQK